MADEFVRDPRRVMAAAHGVLAKRIATSMVEQPVRELQVQLLAAGVAAMDRMSPELTALHYTYNMALDILGKKRS